MVAKSGAGVSYRYPRDTLTVQDLKEVGGVLVSLVSMILHIRSAVIEINNISWLTARKTWPISKLLYVIYWDLLYPSVSYFPMAPWKPARYSCCCFCLNVQNARTSDCSSNHWQVVNKMMRPGRFQDKAQEMKKDLKNRDCRFYRKMLKELGEILWNPLKS